MTYLCTQREKNTVKEPIFCLPATLCLIQEMESMAGVINNFDCPLYSLSNRFNLVHTASILAEVSFVHQCDASCTFISEARSHLVECESIN